VFIIAVRSTIGYNGRSISGASNFAIDGVVYASESKVIWQRRDGVITLISSLELKHAFGG
jgi:hypothetical protein